MPDLPQVDALLHNEVEALRRRVAELEQTSAQQQHQIIELSESEERYRWIVELSPEPIAVHQNGNLIYINHAGANLVGASSAAELVGRSVLDFVHPSYRPLVIERVRATQEQGHATQLVEERFLRLDGSTVDVETMALPISYNGGRATLVVIRDISIRKRAEMEVRFLADSSSVLANSLDLNTTLVLLARLSVPEIADWCFVDLIEDDGSIRRVATAAADTAHEPLLHEVQHTYVPVPDSPQPASRVIHTKEPLFISNLTDEMIAAMVIDQRHLELMRALSPRSVIAAPMIARGHMIGVITVATTTIERRYTAADLRLVQELSRRAAVAVDNARLYGEAQRATEQEYFARQQAERAQQRQAFLAEAITVLSASIEYDITLASLARLLVPTFAIYCIVDIVDADGQIRRIANEHADPTKQPLLRELGQRYSPDWNSPHPAAYTLRTGEPRMFTHLDPSATRDSAHLQLLTDLDTGAWMVVPLIAHTRIIGTLTMVQSTSRPSYTHDDLQFALDLANRAALVVENARLYHEAQQAIRARDQFLSIASHELKTPLTTLLGNAQLLDRRLRDVPLPIERERRSTNVIVEQARRLNRMVDTLLDVSRIETGQMKIERRPVHLVNLVERVAAEIQLISSNHELRLSKPEAVLIVDGDELRLEQVFQNLIQNAIKYSPQGGLIELTFGRTNDHAVVSISDQGIGIPSSAIPQLFSRFYRAANADPTHISGMGIGLFVVREIVTQHNGHIGVRSVEGQGSTFTVELPLIANHE